ncbi:cytidine deaminase [Planococcaceae bacterium Storch 2/2-2]|nr:cytidine deaminase [Planococcaceae bacterium Storch 2/2-2]
MKEQLIERAKRAKARAYAPYSNFHVGAAVQMSDGSIYDGCNIENASYSLTNCAERTAIFKAVSDGKRSIARIAIIGSTDEPIAPCGACRQVMQEFSERTTPVYLTNDAGDVYETTVGDLLPLSFTKEDVHGKSTI